MRRLIFLGAIGLLFAMVVPAKGKVGDKTWSNSYDGYSMLMLPVMPRVAMDSLGDRIFAYTAYTMDSLGTISETRCHVVSFKESGEINWEADVTDSQKVCMVTALTVDRDNNVVVGGGVKSSAGDIDWKIVEFSSSGTRLFERSYDGGHGDDWLSDLSTDSKGNIVGVGSRTNEAGGDDWMVNFFLTNGSVKGCPKTSGSRYGLAFRVVVDARDNAIVVGYVPGATDKDWQVVSYAPEGARVNWEKSFDSGYGNDYAFGVAVDSSGNVAVAGRVSGGGSAYNYDWRVAYYQVSGATAALKWSDLRDGDGNGDAAMSVDFDKNGNAVVGGYISKGEEEDWLLVSYLPTNGTENWHATLDSSAGSGQIWDVAVSNGIVVAAGYTMGERDSDWRVMAYSSGDGSVKWEDTYDSGDVDFAFHVAMDSNGGAVVAGSNTQFTSSFDYKRVRVVSYAGESQSSPPPQPMQGHVLRSGEVRALNVPAQVPDPASGLYLGFGAASKGDADFKLQAGFPGYLDANKTEELEVKIFIAAQLPDDYSRLLYITSANKVEYQPPDTLSSWRSKVTGGIENTTIFDVPTSYVPSGRHYWYTLVVPSTVPDDFSGVDWSTTPWEITVNILELP